MKDVHVEPEKTLAFCGCKSCRGCLKPWGALGATT